VLSFSFYAFEFVVLIVVVACLQSILGAPGRQPEKTENFLR